MDERERKNKEIQRQLEELRNEMQLLHARLQYLKFLKRVGVRKLDIIKDDAK